MEKDVKKLVEGYKKYTGNDFKVQKFPGAPGTTLSKTDLEEPYNINKYLSFVGKLMWYTTKVGPDVENASRELAVHMSHPGPDHWKALGHLISYIKGKENKGIITRNPKVLKAVMFCDSNYSTEKEIRKSVSGLVTTIGGTLLTCLSKTQRTVTLSSTEEEYVTLSLCTQEVKFVGMLLGYTTKVQKPSGIYENNQGVIFLENNRQVGIQTKSIHIRHHFLRDMV